MALTDRLDLRGGRPCWQDFDGAGLESDPPPAITQVAVVGAGITGAMIADRLARAGHAVAQFDRRIPVSGSTAASTALVMWAADVPLTRLVATRGGDAVRAWQRVQRTVAALDEIVRDRAIACSWRPRPELYLAGTLLDEAALREEAALRQAAGLPSAFLAADEVARRFALPPRAALLSDGSYSVDPVALALGFLRSARAAGATLSFPAEVATIAHAGAGAELTLSDGSIVRADHVVLATGYEAPRLFLPDAFKLGSSFAIATPPGTSGGDALPMLWEASDPYLYVRTTSDGRIIIGGEDLDSPDPAARDAQLQAKSGRLAAAGAALLGREDLVVDCAWSATFGRSPDGLPAIGRARNSDRIWLASGFGGNGISFAALAAELVQAGIDGAQDADAPLFDPYRFT